ncbi:MAG: hypothetical protein Q8L21_03585 [Candidatus Komeilibacteria bacterium]|nr:hypothetical protein [Candidatus Komeilibacteria bacterium]
MQEKKQKLIPYFIATMLVTLIMAAAYTGRAAFIEPLVAPAASDQDFAQNILGANNADNDFDSSTVALNADGSIIERLEYIATNLFWTGSGSNIYRSSGNVGVATSVPWGYLSVEGQGTIPAFVVSDTSDNTDFIVDASGNVGIGTTTPGAKFAIQPSANGTNIIYSRRFTDAGPTGNFILFQNAAGDTNLFSVDMEGNTTIGGDLITIGTSTSQTLVINSSVGSSLIPTINNTYDLGSSAKYWKRGYFDELTVNNFGAASTTISGTTESSFVINSDNDTVDAQDSSLTFFRGTVEPNGVMTWDSANDYFSLNQNVFIQNGNTGVPTLLTVKGTADQGTSPFLSVKDNLANTLASINYTGGAYFAGSVGIGTTTPGYLFDNYGSLRVGVAGANDHLIMANTATGRVGIGTSTPGALLSVHGAGLFQSSVKASFFTGTNATATSTFGQGIEFGGGGYVYDNGTQLILGHD